MSKQWHILIVLDDEYLNRNIVNSLQIDGYLVTGVNNGAEAVRLLWAEEYDIVISDQKIPDTDGFELLQWIRTYRPDTRMIMVGAPGSSVTRTQALENGVVSYLEKPLDLHTLKEELRRLLQQTGFSASLDSFDLLDVIQIVNMSHKTIAMVVNTGLEEQGLLGFQAGELIWAEYGVLRGEEAFFALAAYKNGTVIHQPWNAQIRPNVTQPLSRLIFQAVQYRSKYAAFQQHTGEQAALAPAAMSQALQSPDDDDSPFLFVEPVLADSHQKVASSHLHETPAPVQLATNEAVEWWQEPTPHERVHNKIAAQNVNGSQDSSIKPSGTDDNQVSNDSNGAGTSIAPVTAHKTPAGQRTDLPSWLLDQPTQFGMPTMHPSSLAGTGQIPAMPIIKATPAEWQSAAPEVGVAEQSSNKQSSNVPLHRQSSPEWKPPVKPGVGQLQSADEHDLQLQSLTSARKTVDFSSPASSQRSSKRNYPALVGALQTLGYSIPGFIAAAVVSIDGQPIAQVTVDDFDISQMCGYFSSIMQGVLLALDQGAWGHYQDTIITSLTHFILLRLVGSNRDTFQVLIITRATDPVESLEIMANVEPAIESAL